MLDLLMSGMYINGQWQSPLSFCFLLISIFYPKLFVDI